MPRSYIVERLEDLVGPEGQTTHAYEQAMTKLAGEVITRRLESDLDSACESADVKIAYHAFYCKCTLLRNNREYSLLSEFMATAPRRYRKQPSFVHLQLLAKVGLRTPLSDREFLEEAYRDATRHSQSPGYVHMFAGAYAAVGEALEVSDPGENEWLEALAEPAMTAAKKAVSLEPRYAKFRSTLARLYSMSGLFDEAASELDHAIDLEDSSRPDYAIRLGNYEAQKMRNSLRRNGAAIERSVNLARMDAESRIDSLADSLSSELKTTDASVKVALQRVDEASARNLEFLGFFAAVMSFVIATIQISTQFSADEALKLIVVLTGALLAAFSGFNLLVAASWRTAIVRSATIFVVGVSIIVVGYFL